MSKFLIIHGPSQYEVKKAYSVSKYLTEKLPHEIFALAELQLTQKKTYVNFFSFITDPLTGAGLLSFTPSTDGKESISFTGFMIELIDRHDKIIILPCKEILYLNFFHISLGYAIGKEKIVASLNFPGFTLPHWYQDNFNNTVESRPALLEILETL